MPKQSCARGGILPACLVCVTLLSVLASLAVDVGIYMTAKAELQAAADAAALAAAHEMEKGLSPHSVAIKFARDNIPNSQLLLPQPAIQIRLGRWEDGVFVESPYDQNSIRVTLYRAQEYQNPVPLFFAGLLGLHSIDIQASAVASIRPRAPEYNFVGINEVYFSSLGVLARIKGRVVSNGDIHIGQPLGLLVGVLGDARSWGGRVRKGMLAGITGSTRPLPDELVYPSVQLPLRSDNDKIRPYLDSQGDFNGLTFTSIPSGTYVVRDLNLLANVMVRLEGPVTFYVTRHFNMAATVNLLGNPNFSPSMFKVRVAPGGEVHFLANLLSPLNMDLYAPDTEVDIAVGINRYYGRLIAKRLHILLPVLGEFEEARNLDDPNAGCPTVCLVQ